MNYSGTYKIKLSGFLKQFDFEIARLATGDSLTMGLRWWRRRPGNDFKINMDGHTLNILFQINTCDEKGNV